MISVSIVIPLYNKGPHISRTIQSVLNQTEQNFEIIVVDGQSTDEGPKIVKSFEDPRIFFFEQVGSGVSSARNEGISHSRSDFVAFLDADDEWMPDHLETLLRLREAYPEAGAYTTAYLVKCVPTLTLAYSIKAKGINIDIFGSDEYCLQPGEITIEKIISSLSRLTEDETNIRQKLHDEIPKVQERAYNAGKYLKDILEEP